MIYPNKNNKLTLINKISLELLKKECIFAVLKLTRNIK